MLSCNIEKNSVPERTVLEKTVNLFLDMFKVIPGNLGSNDCRTDLMAPFGFGGVVLGKRNR